LIVHIDFINTITANIAFLGVIN